MRGICSGVFQAVADGISVLPSALWLIRLVLDGDFPEEGLERIRPCPPPLDPLAVLAVAAAEDQILVGRLHQELEHDARGRMRPA